MNKEQKAAFKAHLLEVIKKKAKGMQVKQVAEVIGILPANASHLLNGRLNVFSVEAMLGYCQALGVTVEYKIGGRIYRPE